MTETTSAETTRLVEMTPKEIELTKTALKLLHGILGRDEADELAEVSALLDKFAGVEPARPVSGPAPDRPSAP